ncbi:hypothetical protein F5051DRAFT_433521 [Lentinula edodes]|nr:hypothetical protein F5051DRAFT_433521 [Lentinula edodes]KAJ3884682.1 hypothetical protein GG344DRAFT_71147 [Lentinula edodes]
MSTVCYTRQWIAPLDVQQPKPPYNPQILALLYAFPPPTVKLLLLCPKGGIRLRWVKAHKNNQDQVILYHEYFINHDFLLVGFEEYLQDIFSVQLFNFPLWFLELFQQLDDEENQVEEA